MSRSVTRMTIDDAGHLSPERRAGIIASYPPHEVEARTKGIPVLGSGRIFPVTEESIAEDPFPIPRHWALIGGLDFGWDHPTAAAALAWDRDSDVLHVVSCYRRRQATPLEHAAALKPWGAFPWAWPADAAQSAKADGRKLRDEYVDSGLVMLGAHATHPDGGNGVEAGVMEMLTRMQTGRLKVFRHLNDWWQEFRLYHRKDGKIVKERDDLMDATRYALMMRRFAEAPEIFEGDTWENTRGLHGRSGDTGY